MSGALLTAPMGAVPMNPNKGLLDYNQAQASQFLPAQAQATVAETQARAGLTGQQAIGAGIQNQIAALGLPFQQAIYGQMIGALQGGSAYTADQVLASGGQAPQGGVAASAGGGQGGGGAIGTYATTAEPVASPGGAIGGGAVPAPVQSAPLPAIGNAAPMTPSAPVAPSGTGISALGGAAPSGGAPAQPSAASGGVLPPKITGPGGLMIRGVPFPMPSYMALGYMQAQDKAKALDQIMGARTTLLRQRAMEAMGANGQVDPDRWNVAVKEAFNDGLIDNSELMRFYSHPELGQSFINTFLPPEQNPALQGAIAGSRAAAEVGPRIQQAAGTAAAQAAFDLVDVPMPGPNGTTRMQKMTRGQAVQMFNGQLPPGTVASGQGGDPNAPMSGDTYAQLVKGRESPGGNPYAPNASGPGGTPTSTAVGDHQFVNDTWLTEMKQHRPDLTNGRTDQQILAMRGIPGLSAEMAQAYAQDNAPILQRGGLPVNAASLALAHGFGPAGAVKIAQADQNTPMTSIFPPKADGTPNDVIKANPTYANQTTGQILQGFINRFGTGPVNFGNPASVGVGGGGGQYAQQPGQTAPQPTPTQENRIKIDNDQLKEDSGDIDKRMSMASVAAGAKPVLMDVKRLAPQAITGAMSGVRQSFANFVNTFAPAWGQKFLDDTKNLSPDANVASQELIKQLLKNTTNAEAQMGQGAGSVRFGAMLTQFLARANPNAEMAPTAIVEMSNWLLTMNQMLQDYATASQNHFHTARASFGADAIANPYQPLNNFDATWLKSDSTNAPAVYQAAALAMNHKPFSEWSKGLSGPQIEQVGGIVARTDPTDGGLLNSKNQWVTSQQLVTDGKAPDPLARFAGH